MKTSDSNRKDQLKSRKGRPPADQTEARDKNLRDAAKEVFTEFGFERAKLSEIAKRASASKETLYSRYSDKDTLFREVITQHLMHAFKPFGLIADTPLAPLEQTLKNVALGLLSSVLREEGPRVSEVIMQEASRFPDLARYFYEVTHERAISELAAFFEAHIAAGNLRAGDTQEMASQFLGVTVNTAIIRCLLYVERSATPTRKRHLAQVGVSAFLKMYAL